MTIVSQYQITEPYPVLVLIGGILFILTIGAGIYFSALVGSLYPLCRNVLFGAIAFIICIVPQQNSGRTRYEVLLDRNVTYEEILEEYDIVGGDFPYLYLEKKNDE